MRKKRDKKEQKIAQKKHYDGLEAKTDESSGRLPETGISERECVRVYQTEIRQGE